MAVVSGVLWFGEVLKAAGNVRVHPTGTQNRLRAALTVQGGQGAHRSAGHPPSSFLPGRSAVGGGEMGEIALQLWLVGASSNPQAVGFPLSCQAIGQALVGGDRGDFVQDWPSLSAGVGGGGEPREVWL